VYIVYHSVDIYSKYMEVDLIVASTMGGIFCNAAFSRTCDLNLMLASLNLVSVGL